MEPITITKDGVTLKISEASDGFKIDVQSEHGHSLLANTSTNALLISNTCSPTPSKKTNYEQLLMVPK